MSHIYNICCSDLLRSLWKRTARKAVLFAYGESTLYLMTPEAFSDILGMKASHKGAHKGYREVCHE